jgi:PUL domain
LQKRQLVCEHVSPFIQSDNKNLRQAAVTVLFNYSVLFLDKPDAEGKIQAVSAVSNGAVRNETDAQTLMRVLGMLGNLGYHDEETKELVKAMVGEEIQAIKDPKTMEGADEGTVKLIKEIIKFIME